MSKEVISKFYQAFQQKDWQTMQACYHEDVVFEDPAFGELKGDDAKKMWKMLCEQGKDLKLEFSNVTENSAHWDAFYTFSATKRKVENHIDATFEFKDGLIVKHVDDFDFHKWSKQALGLIGSLFGGTKLFQRKFRNKVLSILKKY